MKRKTGEKIRVQVSRSSHRRRCSVRKGVPRNFAKVTGKHLYQSLFFDKETLAQVFPVNFAKFQRITFLQNTSERLFLGFSHPFEMQLAVSI